VATAQNALSARVPFSPITDEGVVPITETPPGLGHGIIAEQWAQLFLNISRRSRSCSHRVRRVSIPPIALFTLPAPCPQVLEPTPAGSQRALLARIR
jgi:hypothetical protein